MNDTAFWGTRLYDAYPDDAVGPLRRVLINEIDLFLIARASG
jgi:hypothetical protein